MATEVTRDDLNRVHSRIDGFERDLSAARERNLELVAAANAQIAQLNTSLTLIGERLANLNKTVDELPEPPPPPEPVPLPKRPCEFLEGHLKDHKETRLLWLRPIAGSVVTAVISGGLAAWAMVKILIESLGKSSN